MALPSSNDCWIWSAIPKSNAAETITVLDGPKRPI
jgi:hypothetical protein